MEALENRQAITTFIKVKAHRGQLLNKQADYMAVQGTRQPKDLAFACDRNPGFRKWDVEITDTTDQDKETALVYLTDRVGRVSTLALVHCLTTSGNPDTS